MVDSILSSSASISPDLILGYESSRTSGAVVHPIVGRPAPDVTLRRAGLRRGRMQLGFLGEDAESASADAETALSAAAVFSLVSDDRSTIQMRFVLPSTGAITRQLDPDTRETWSVTFDWQEVSE